MDEEDLREIEELAEEVATAIEKMIIAIMDSEDLAKAMAQFSMSYYKELIASGFTEEQAFQIMLRAPTGSFLQNPMPKSN